MIGLLLLAASALILIAGAELFAEHAAGAGRRLRISAVAVALLLAGAEPEEMVTALIAALGGRPELAAGDAIGANVTMFTLALGVAALARPLPFGGRVRQYAFGSAAAGGLAVLALWDGTVSRPEGSLLIAAYVVAVGGVWWRERQPPVIGEVEEAIEDEAEVGASGATRVQPSCCSGWRRPASASCSPVAGWRWRARPASSPTSGSVTASSGSPCWRSPPPPSCSRWPGRPPAATLVSRWWRRWSARRPTTRPSRRRLGRAAGDPEHPARRGRRRSRAAAGRLPGSRRDLGSRQGR